MTFFHLNGSPRGTKSFAPPARSGKMTGSGSSARVSAVQVNQGDFERY